MSLPSAQHSPMHGFLSALLLAGMNLAAAAASFDAAPFGLPLPGEAGVRWEDPREIHRVVVHFEAAPPALAQLRLEYWGSWWPERHLPKDREPGGGDLGWMELGNWWKNDWRVADADATAEGNDVQFTFRPVNAKEFPKVAGYPAGFRYTLKIRVRSDGPLPKVKGLEAFTDSVLTRGAARLVWEKAPGEIHAQACNGQIVAVDSTSARSQLLALQVVANSDPNTFDRTLITVHDGPTVFTFAVDELTNGPLFLPHLGVAVLPENDRRDFAAVASEIRARGAKTLYDRVSELPEQTWREAWKAMPRKKSDIYFPLGLDGGRQRFRLNADGSVAFRSNDQYLKNRPGRDTPRLNLEPAPVHVRFNLPDKPVHRTLEDESLPICRTTWEVDGVRIEQEAYVTPVEGTVPQGPAPPGDAFAIFMARFTLTNASDAVRTATLPIAFGGGPSFDQLRLDTNGRVWDQERLRGQVLAEGTPTKERGKLTWSWPLEPGESKGVVVKIPYVVLAEGQESEALVKLDFEAERKAVADYWRRRLDQSAQLRTPEPMLNEFYRSHAMHLLINCELEPRTERGKDGPERRFARVGSFGYGAYGNESCMMVLDLDRRGYHREAQACLDAWLHYQGTVGLPGSFASKEGVLYGAGGYEAGGYNQHHGWILWMLAEHYRFTRDEAWLRRAAPGLVAGAAWIIRETARTKDRDELERGLLPAGSLEDIGDWWTWLSTSCYTWRGLDAAAWALGQIGHPEAKRLREGADAYHEHLLANFRAASQRSPVVRLRDGTAVPKIPSHVHRRGRCFGWICETLEGSLHLLITRAIGPHSPEADWILKDYEDNLYLSNQYGYTLEDFDSQWFGRGGMSMQACLLLGVEPYLYRDDVKHALRALFNAQAVSYFPDVRMNTEHALPDMADWRGDHFKSSDESNAAGWLRDLFVREEGQELWLGQAVPRDWLKPGQRCGLERAATYFGQTTILYTAGDNQITAQLDGPQRNPPKAIRLRFRQAQSRPLASVTVRGAPWKDFAGEWVNLPGDIGRVVVEARF